MTFNDGCLGSRNDEERSEMRYVMRIAELVNHQTLERILRFRIIPGAFLFEYLFSPLILPRVKNGLWAFILFFFFFYIIERRKMASRIMVSIFLKPPLLNFVSVSFLYEKEILPKVRITLFFPFYLL